MSLHLIYASLRSESVMRRGQDNEVQGTTHNVQGTTHNVQRTTHPSPGDNAPNYIGSKVQRYDGTTTRHADVNGAVLPYSGTANTRVYKLAHVSHKNPSTKTQQKVHQKPRKLSKSSPVEPQISK